MIQLALQLIQFHLIHHHSPKSKTICVLFCLGRGLMTLLDLPVLEFEKHYDLLDHYLYWFIVDILDFFYGILPRGLGNNDNSGPISTGFLYVPGWPCLKLGHLCPHRFHFLDLLEAMARRRDCFNVSDGQVAADVYVISGNSVKWALSN
ncbi:hypothetical protein HKD37_01G000590 [Glycine soja]